jgi:hypothetical protein
VLLPSDTHRKPITSITAVLLPFVTYLLTLPRIAPRLKKPENMNIPTRMAKSHLQAKTRRVKLQVCTDVCWGLSNYKQQREIPSFPSALINLLYTFYLK